MTGSDGDGGPNGRGEAVIEVHPRFESGTGLFWVFLVGAGMVVLLAVLLVRWAGVFDPTEVRTERITGAAVATTQPPSLGATEQATGSAPEGTQAPAGTEAPAPAEPAGQNDGPATATVETTTSSALRPATFAIVAMLGLGALTLVAAAVLGLAELTRSTARPVVYAPTPDPNAPGTRNLGPAGAAAGAAAIGQALASIVGAFGNAFKGMKTSGMMAIAGASMVLGAALVAWQTVPGVDPNPTFTESATTTTTTTAARTTTEPVAGGTTAPPTSGPPSTEPASSGPASTEPASSSPTTTEPTASGDDPDGSVPTGG